MTMRRQTIRLDGTCMEVYYSMAKSAEPTDSLMKSRLLEFRKHMFSVDHARTCEILF